MIAYCPKEEKDPIDGLAKMVDEVSGQPVLKGTRVPAEVVLLDEEYGRTPEQTNASFTTIRLQTIRALLAFG